jgi:hypothetical protein
VITGQQSTGTKATTNASPFGGGQQQNNFKGRGGF